MKMHLSTKILIGLVLGVFAGLALGSDGLPFAKAWIAPFGTIFMNMIKMIIVPLVFSSLIVGICGLGDVNKIGRVGAKTIAYYLGTTAFAIVLGLVLGTLLSPGTGINMPSGDVKAAAKAAPPLMQVIVAIFPTNPVDAMLQANMLQIIVFALFMGGGITLVGERADSFFKFFDGMAEACYKVVGMIMWFAPIGVFALMTPVTATYGPAVLFPLLKVIIAVYLGCAMHAFIVYGFLLKTVGKMNPMTFFKGILPAQMVAFSTCSSSATLPVSFECVQDMGVSKEVSSFVLPLGATINMDGTALYQGVCALFVAQIYGIDLSMGQYVTIILTGTLASIGTAGVPGAGLIMLTMILQAVGLPLEGAALVAGIDRILDMPRTTVNITGDATVALIVDKGEKDREARLANS